MDTNFKSAVLYDIEIDYVAKVRKQHGLTSRFSVTGRAYDIANGRRFFPAKHTVVIRVDYDGGFGRPVVGKELVNPTWLEVWMECDRLMKKSGDDHHIFLEEVEFDHFENHVLVFKAWFGS